MPMSSPYVIVLSDAEEAVLSARARSGRGAVSRPAAGADRAGGGRGGTNNTAIAVQVGVCTDTVRKWRGRFAAARLAGLTDATAQWAATVFTAADRAEVKALACQLPAETGVPLSRWSCPELAREAGRRRCHVAVSASTVRRWLAADALKPWQHRSWIFIRDPDFAVKAARVLDLYARIFDGEPLGEDEYVICADEKTSIQARCRCHPTLAPGQGPGDARRTTSTTAAARWPTWPPTTSTEARCSAAASPPPASSRSAAWSTRS